MEWYCVCWPWLTAKCVEPVSASAELLVLSLWAFPFQRYGWFSVTEFIHLVTLTFYFSPWNWYAMSTMACTTFLPILVLVILFFTKYYLPIFNYFLQNFPLKDVINLADPRHSSPYPHFKSFQFSSTGKSNTCQYTCESKIYHSKTTYIGNEANTVQVSRQMRIMECYQMRENGEILCKYHTNHH